MQIQIDLPKELNKKIEHYKIDKDCYDKKEAVIRILGEFFKENE